jgi:hypothetical protein
MERHTMSKKITLPSGATATLKDPSLLRVKDRKKVLKSTDVEGGELTKALALQAALVAMLIEDWSFDFAIPNINLDSLDELEMRDYDALIEETSEAQKYLFPSITDTPANEADPKAITADSKD